MSTLVNPLQQSSAHPVRLEVESATSNRDRLSTFFRLPLAFPHLILVGGPLAATFSWTWGSENGSKFDLGAGGGILGAAAGIVAVIAWFSILFTGQYPAGLRSFAAMYLRWRVRAVAYLALLRDEYPPFGEGPYPVSLELTAPVPPRDRLAVAFRIFLVLPHLVAMWALGIAWGFTTVIAWFMILFTGDYPPDLYRFGVGVLRWNTRVEAYLLLLHDEYPPFSLS